MVHDANQSPTTDLPIDSYLVMGLATCYVRQEGETQEVYLLEPVPSAYLESLLQGIPTSYRAIWGTTLAQAGDLAGRYPRPGADQLAQAIPCADFEQRAAAAARTYQSRPAAADLVPVGTGRCDINYSTEKKRILNGKTAVSAADNVKQHKYTHEVL
ncbi:MAG: hypothetical protein HC922_01085 [Leptolyngbyaceae cyanobacterium SM2_3_12]|nr:hypothetical protein [Leptolyngbyaceae cyanobacterium SM2_3_12]